MEWRMVYKGQGHCVSEHQRRAPKPALGARALSCRALSSAVGSVASPLSGVYAIVDTASRQALLHCVHDQSAPLYTCCNSCREMLGAVWPQCACCRFQTAVRHALTVVLTQGHHRAGHHRADAGVPWRYRAAVPGQGRAGLISAVQQPLFISAPVTSGVCGLPL